MTTPPDGPRARSLPVRMSALLLALAWIAGACLVQVEIGGRLVIVPWLMLGPILASMALCAGDTSVAAVVAVLAVAWLSRWAGDLDHYPGVLRTLGAATTGGVAVLNAAVRVRRETKLRSMTEVARIAQATILRPVPPSVAGLQIAARYQSADADSLVGGDLFEVLDLGDRVRVLIGDVRGKGLPAVQLAAAVLSAFRVHGTDRDAALDTLAGQLEIAAVPGMTDEDFVTVLLCDVWADGRLEVVSCGHPAPLIVDADGTATAVSLRPGPPLGLGGGPPRRADSVLPAGWRLLLYTDGLVEARDPSGRFLDRTEIAAALRGGLPGGAAPLPEPALDRLLGVVRRHVGGTPIDDLAVLLVAPAAG